jgi:NTE family protein
MDANGASRPNRRPIRYDPRVSHGAPPSPGPAGGDSPLALALSGGGARAAYQVGVLSGIAERCGGELRFPIVTGVSAGAINAAAVAANCQRSPDQVARLLERAWLNMSTRKVFRSGPWAVAVAALKLVGVLVGGGFGHPFPARGLLNTRPLRHTLTKYFRDDAVAENIAAGHLRALALSTTSYSTSRTVTFVQGTGDLTTWRRSGRTAVHARITVDHVLASCALPLVFPAVQLDDEFFGDGSLRQTTPLAPAIHLGARRLLALAVRRRTSVDEEDRRRVAGYPPPAQIVGMLFNAVFLDALEADTERAERINRSLAQLPAGATHPDGLRPLNLVVVHPSYDLGQLAAGLEAHLPGTLRWLVRALGTRGLKAPDLLSYLLFERAYIERLLDVGREDAAKHWDRIARLLDGA